MIISTQSKAVWSLDSIETSSTGILACANCLVSNNYLQENAVVAFRGGWNSKHKHAIGVSVDTDNRDSIQICINSNPGVNKFVDREEIDYFTPLKCIRDRKKSSFRCSTSFFVKFWFQEWW